MKNHTIKTPTAELLIVELSEGLSQIRKNTLWVMQHEGWEILGKPDEIREDDVRGLVDSKEAILSTIYRNYNGGTAFGSRLESFFSLLESEIYWNVNPIEKPPKNDLNGSFFTMQTNFHKEIQYEEAEQKTFDRNRSVIFKKVTPKI